MTVAAIAWIALELGRAQATPTETVQLSVVAVKGVRDGRQPQYIDPGIPKKSHAALKPLGYDSYFKLQTADIPIPFGRETKIFITDVYELIVQPTGRDAQGRVQIKARIMMQSKTPNAPPKKALDTTLAMTPGKTLNLGGPKVDGGDLILVLTLN